MYNLGKLVLVLGMCCMTMVNAKPANQYYRNFWYPLYQGERLAYCAADQKTCGKVIAERYCQTMGYQKAVRQIIAYNTGLTHFIDTRTQCTGWACNGFELIRCAALMQHAPPNPYHYRLRKFVLPRYERYRVDWCYKEQKDCGHRAAFSFCRRMGYMKEKGYKQAKHVLATRALGDQKLCFGECSGFESITCYR